MRNTLFAAFESSDQAERAAGALMDHGLRAEDVTLVVNREYDQIEHDRYVPVGHRVRVFDDGSLHETTGSAYGGNVIQDTGRMGFMGEDPLNTTSGRAYGLDMAGGIESTDALTHYPGSDQPFKDDDGAPVTNFRDEHKDDVPVATGEGSGMAPLHAATGISTTTPQDAGAGAIKGAAVGLGVGVAAALASIFIPGVGLVLGTAAVATAIAGAAATAGAGAVAGGVVGYLKDQGVPDEELTVYRDTYNRGGAILAVNVPTDFNRADIEAIAAKYGAQNIDTYGEVREV